MEILKYKYKPTQVVYYVSHEWKHESTACTDCGGIGILTRKDGKEITCPSCKGKKTYEVKGKRIETVKSDIVEHIEIYIENDEIEITYYLEDKGGLAEKELFETEEDARSTFEKGAVGYEGCSGWTGDPFGAGSHGAIGFTGEVSSSLSNIPKEMWGVHRTHCCSIHGCKYGNNNNCPVYLVIIKQDYPCEECNDENS